MENMLQLYIFGVLLNMAEICYCIRLPTYEPLWVTHDSKVRGLDSGQTVMGLECGGNQPPTPASCSPLEAMGCLNFALLFLISANVQWDKHQNACFLNLANAFLPAGRALSHYSFLIFMLKLKWESSFSKWDAAPSTKKPSANDMMMLWNWEKA